MLEEIMTVYCKNHRGHINAVCGEMCKACSVKLGSTYS